jgi:hypothetical protein
VPRPLLARLLLLVGLGASAPARAAKVPNIDPAAQTGDRAGRDAALIIGNEGYAALPQAQWATDDARSFRGWAEATRGITRSRIQFATDADTDTIWKLTKRASWRVRKRGTLWVYFAGHGSVDEAGRRVILPVEADAATLTSRGIPLDDLIDKLRKTNRADRIVVVLDAGFGNVARDGLELVPGREVAVEAGFPTEDDRVVYWAADAGAGRSEPFEPAKHGLFTWTALGALRGWADGELDGQPDGRVTFAEAQLYARRVGRQFGRVVDPSRDPRSEPGSWTLAQGSHLEAGPDDALLAELAQEDITRRMRAAEERVLGDARLFWDDTLALAREAQPAEGRAMVEQYVKAFESSTASLTWAIAVPEVREARRLLATWEETGGLAPQAMAAAAPGPQVVEEATCDDLVAIEGPAMLGELSPGQRACLDQRITAERLQTGKDGISRLLLVDAEARGDATEWERLMIRHLEDIDRSDPDLCFRFAIHLHKSKDVELAEEAFRWAAIALENKDRWEGEPYVKKVYGLLRLRAEAGNRLWQDAEKRYAKEASPDNDADVRDFRGLAKHAAREWLDYARAAHQPTDVPYQMCMSAAGTREFCAEAR